MTFEVDLPRIERAVTEILEAIGEDVSRDGIRETPARVARMYAEVCSGIHEEPADHLIKTFDVDHDEMVMVRDIPMYSICEHHLVPFFGVAHVAYIPRRGGMITGLSKLARLVEGYSRRPQVQERLTSQVADAIQRTLDPQGTLVVVEAEHEGYLRFATLTIHPIATDLVDEELMDESESQWLADYNARCAETLMGD